MSRQELSFPDEHLIVFVRNPGDDTIVVLEDTRPGPSMGESITVKFKTLKEIVKQLKKSGWHD